jgi:uncharacterized BrkB/YihY/UPF0761 family membrane protein
MPREGRIAGHVRLLGILWLAISAFRLIPGLILVALWGARPYSPLIPAYMWAPGAAIGMVFLFFAGIGIAAGCGLLARQPWARMLAIIFGVLSLVDIPLGTAIGVYTLWLFLPAESEQEYKTMSRAA